MSNHRIATITEFAFMIHKLLRSDRDVNLGCSGMTGEGKSTFTTILQKEYSRIAGVDWSFNNMTWDRDEMMKWIDGEGESKEGQKPEYTAILPDELFHMFYRRNWHDSGQINSIATFNMCRDRHLFLAGNVPNFWKLDTAFVERIRFYAYVPRRGVAWVFEQENNPFATDQWNQDLNRKQFRKEGKPYNCPNFLFEIHFSDWDEEEKKEYYKIRNEKRVKALNKESNDKPTIRQNKDGLALGAVCNLLCIHHGYNPRRLEREVLKIRDHRTITKRINEFKLWYSTSQST